MTTAQPPMLEPEFSGVPLLKYAAVEAAQRDGHGLERALAVEGLDELTGHGIQAYLQILRLLTDSGDGQGPASVPDIHNRKHFGRSPARQGLP